MSGGGKHLWRPSMAGCSGNRTRRPPVSAGFSLLKIEKSGKTMNECFLVCNYARVDLFQLSPLLLRPQILVAYTVLLLGDTFSLVKPAVS